MRKSTLLMQGTEVRHVSGEVGFVVVPVPDANGAIVVRTEDDEYDTWLESDIRLHFTIKDTYILLATPGIFTRQWSSVERCKAEAETMRRENRGTPLAILSVREDGEAYELERL